MSEAAKRDRDIVGLLRTARRHCPFAQVMRRHEGKVYRLGCALLGERAQAAVSRGGGSDLQSLRQLLQRGSDQG